MKNKQIIINFTEEFWIGLMIVGFIGALAFAFWMVGTGIYDSGREKGFKEGYDAVVLKTINQSKEDGYIDFVDKYQSPNEEIRLYTYEGCPYKNTLYGADLIYNPFWQNGSIRIINQGDMR